MSFLIVSTDMFLRELNQGSGLEMKGFPIWTSFTLSYWKQNNKLEKVLSIHQFIYASLKMIKPSEDRSDDSPGW